MIKARLKYIIKTQKGKVPKTFSDDSSYPPYLSMDYLRGDSDKILYVKPKDEYKLVDEKEVLVLWDGANAGEVMFSKKGFISSTMAIVTPDTNFFEKRFLFYFLKSIEGELKKASTGTTIPHLDQNFLFNTHFKFPEVDIQKPIADYLDTQSAKITHFIQTKQRFIELLKEQRQSIITNAVTKGIDENVQMKETGIDWMPEVPEHWEMRKIRRIFDGMSSGTTPESGNMKYYENGQTNWINTGDLNDGLLTYCKYKVTKRALEDYPTLKIYPIGTILVAMYGATIGKVSLMEIEGCTNQACCALYDSKIYIKEFSLFSLLAAKDALIRESYGGGQPNISQDVIKRFKLPVPPSEEQKQIVEHIISETKTLDIAISKAEREIELIKEYREAMIAEAVTGKMKL